MPYGVNSGRKSMLDRGSLLVYKFVNKGLMEVLGGRSSVVEHQLPKLDTPVRFWSPALVFNSKTTIFFPFFSPQKPQCPVVITSYFIGSGLRDTFCRLKSTMPVAIMR